eukprot:XP_027302343.1 isochorismatase domain-containing protein 1 isoform X1 [Anas platyrhynchos]
MEMGARWPRAPQAGSLSLGAALRSCRPAAGQHALSGGAQQWGRAPGEGSAETNTPALLGRGGIAAPQSHQTDPIGLRAPQPWEEAMTTLGNLTPSSTVFFCCDMQERFRPAIKYFGDIISVGQRLLQGARLLGIPVIVTEQYPKGLGSTVQEIDLTGAKLVLPKTKFSMVLPEVEAALADIPGVRSVVLFGVETHVCIQQTALELIGRGLEVHIVADATSSRSMMDRMFALERLARTGIIVTTSEAILLQLVADKEHPKFKEIQNLIKASAPESGLLSKV